MHVLKVIRPIALYAGKKLRLYKAKQALYKATQLEKNSAVTFTCNICGSCTQAPASFIARERISCTNCGSTMRYRAMVNALALGLYGNNIGLPLIKDGASKRGIGISDARDYAEPLAKVFDYTNTFYHKKPFLDLTGDVTKYLNALDFIMISDVLEHVCPPVERAFSNLFAMLKSGGVCIITVPFTCDHGELEHYPDLNHFTIERRENKYAVINTTVAGERQVFSEPVFHGGAGLTLEMRIFSRASLIRQLKAAGFAEVDVVDEDCAEFGISWGQDPSVPIIARKRA